MWLAFWYTKLKLSVDYLYVIRKTFRSKAQKSEHHKSAYLISYSLKWLTALSWEPFVLWSCSALRFNRETHFSIVIFNYKIFQVNRKWLNSLFCKKWLKIAYIIISRAVSRMKVVYPSLYTEAPLLYCNLQIEEIHQKWLDWLFNLLKNG